MKKKYKKGVLENENPNESESKKTSKTRTKEGSFAMVLLIS